MSRALLALGSASSLFFSLSGSVTAADLEVPHYPHGVHAQDCGPCGCLQVVWVRHRDILQTYGIHFDPRNYDMTEPHFYLGPVRAYPRYFVDGIGPVGPGEARCQP